MITEVSTMCLSEDDWAAARGRRKPTKTKPLRLSGTDVHFNHNTTKLPPSSLQTVPTLPNDTTNGRLGNCPPSNCAQLRSLTDMNEPYTSPELDPSPLPEPSLECGEYATQSNSSCNPITISPQEIWTNDSCFSANGQAHMVPSMEYHGFSDAFDPNPLTSKPRRDSAHTHTGGTTRTKKRPSPGRKRKTEKAEPDSARAKYLEKNRQAASKCRSKQKKQEEELVEAARHMERKNKVLKAEVELLKSGMRDLMEIVGQHANCSDARLMTYVQREADRRASGGILSSFSTSTSSKTSLSPETSQS